MELALAKLPRKSFTGNFQSYFSFSLLHMQKSRIFMSTNSIKNCVKSSSSMK